MKNKRKSKLAISSLILSIIGFSSIIFLYLSPYTCIIGPAVVISAILYGHFVKARIRKNPIIFGKKLVTAGLIIGYIYIAIFTVFLIHLYFLDNAMIDGYRMFKIEKVVRRCNGYISNNNGKFPKNLQHIFKYNDNHYLISTVTKDTSKPSYKFVLKGNIADYPNKSNTVMITEVVPNKRGNKLVVYLDGRIEIISDDKKTTNVYSRSTGSIQPKK